MTDGQSMRDPDAKSQGEPWEAACEQMNYETTFNNGLMLVLPTGGTRFLCACQWHDDPAYVIEGRTLKRFATARDDEPEKVEELPIGTKVLLWDEAAGNPELGVIGDLQPGE